MQHVITCKNYAKNFDFKNKLLRKRALNIINPEINVTVVGQHERHQWQGICYRQNRAEMGEKQYVCRMAFQQQ